MAIQNREKPGVIPLTDFDPGSISPEEIVIVEDAGKRMPYIGIAAGEAVRLATYSELENVMVNIETARNGIEAAKTAIEAAKRAEEANEKAEKAFKDILSTLSGLEALLRM